MPPRRQDAPGRSCDPPCMLPRVGGGGPSGAAKLPRRPPGGQGVSRTLMGEFTILLHAWVQGGSRALGEANHPGLDPVDAGDELAPTFVGFQVCLLYTSPSPRD